MKEKLCFVKYSKEYSVNCLTCPFCPAFPYLQKGALFIAGVTDELLSVGSEMRYIGPGCYVEILQRVTGRNPIVLAMPGLPLNDALKKMFSIENPRRVLFVGDQPEIDINFGHISNYQTLLVGTGRYKEEDLKTLAEKPDELPDYYIDSFAEFEKIVTEVVACKVAKQANLEP